MRERKEIVKDVVNRRWKNNNPKYLFELQKFLDVTENVEDEELQKIIINQMIRCDKRLTIIAEERFKSLKQKNKIIRYKKHKNGNYTKK